MIEEMHCDALEFHSHHSSIVAEAEPVVSGCSWSLKKQSSYHLQKRSYHFRDGCSCCGSSSFPGTKMFYYRDHIDTLEYLSGCNRSDLHTVFCESSLCCIPGKYNGTFRDWDGSWMRSQSLLFQYPYLSEKRDQRLIRKRINSRKTRPLQANRKTVPVDRLKGVTEECKQNKTETKKPSDKKTNETDE